MDKQSKLIKDNAITSKGKERQRQSMIGKILPRRDFERVIEHDKIYSNALSQHLEFLTIKQDILSKKCEPHLNSKTQTRDGIIKSIDTLCEFAKTRIECLDLNANLRIQNKLVNDKINHYEEIFLPQYKKEMEEMEKDYDKFMNRAKELVSVKKVPPLYEEITNKVKEELLWFNDLKQKDKEYDEYRLMIFKPLKRLINALDGLKIKDE